MRNCPVQKGTVMTTGVIVLAITGMMADSCCRPEVVHGPYNGFPAVKYLTEILYRQHPLIDPVQVDNICLSELRQASNVRPCVRDVNTEEIVFHETIGMPDNNAFPKKIAELLPSAGREACYGRVITLPVSDQHSRIHTLPTESFLQPAASHGCSASTFRCVD